MPHNVEVMLFPQLFRISERIMIWLRLNDLFSTTFKRFSCSADSTSAGSYQSSRNCNLLFAQRYLNTADRLNCPRLLKSKQYLFSLLYPRIVKKQCKNMNLYKQKCTYCLPYDRINKIRCASLFVAD